ncbi:hypothetical protein F4680DRAFT_469083 [Xylaria scruposa]|nr:hypothetical protein F4680DRAFT_469083 [Xylaria scruposa]
MSSAHISPEIPQQSPLFLLFGPIARGLDHDTVTKLRDGLAADKKYEWISRTISSLPEDWKTIQSSIKDIRITSSGLKSLEDIRDAFDQTGRQLIVALHLAQFIRFAEETTPGVKYPAGLNSRGVCLTQAVGFCIGTLAAFAVSSSRSRAEFEHNGSVAIRLGMLIGMAVDAQDEALGPSGCLSIIWNSKKQEEDLDTILRDDAEAYVSVNYDDNRATVTTALSSISELQHRLNVSGMNTTEVGLRGRFHSPRNLATFDAIMDFCSSRPEYQLPDASNLAVPVQSDARGTGVQSGPLHHYALHSILVKPSNWFQAFSIAREALVMRSDALVITIGPERCIPPSLIKGINQQVYYLADLYKDNQGLLALPIRKYVYSDNDIAVIGMSCKVAGADDLEQFWELLCSGQSQHREVPRERFGFETAFRDEDPTRKWFANLIDGYDMFDHKFFKKSPRESANTDPQQRQLLQIAYQAVEQSGYFHSSSPDKNVGCFIGICSCDYEANVACHAANPFTAVGNLQSFIAGKISHYFGWTGPGLTIDTACSSSAVAVHQACRAIISGECKSALAGGSHVMTNPLWFQNLAGASFLSPTGQCKPFDAAADGYCRGEGIATVFLKRASAALADGDQILGIIAATAVQQNQNCTPIFVPNVPSLSDLFRNITSKSRLLPAQISVVEAHGTGTPVGDPVEYQSVCQVFGSSNRNDDLVLGSVKGSVGHVECTSGVVSLIKVLLMIQKGMVPPQASFNNINPTIGAKSTDRIKIPTSLQAWSTGFRAALINNYGASGSNASMILTQHTGSPKARILEGSPGDRYPFRLCGIDDQSLRRYARAFRTFLGNKTYTESQLSLPNISFNANRQSNIELGRFLLLAVRSKVELEQKLLQYESKDAGIDSFTYTEPPPTVLCFGGQVSLFVGLDRVIYERVAILRRHLDAVDHVVQDLDAGSIFPAIFKSEPVEDHVRLHWIDSGIRPAALVGHSFGELTALCISQTLSLRDTVQMVLDRASLVRDSWGSDRGAMIAIEGDLADIHVQAKPTIACYNGPRSFTIAGSTIGIDAVSELVSKTPSFSSLRTKRLNVTNAFHCSLVDPICDSLEKGAQNLEATEFATEKKLSAKFVADHMRFPQYPSCVFLEAGSNSTVTKMASHALEGRSGCTFQAINLTSGNAWNAVGLHTPEYLPLLLPPYQFEQSRHWLDLKLPPKTIPVPISQVSEPDENKLLTIAGSTGDNRQCAKFKVNTTIPMYTNLVAGHVIASTAPICPATVQLDLVIKAVQILKPDPALSKSSFQFLLVQYPSPLCINQERATWVELSEVASSGGGPAWDFEIFSTDLSSDSQRAAHTTGSVIFALVDNPLSNISFSRLERMAGYERCVELLKSGEVDEILQSRNIYKVFSDVVDYSEEYRGLKKLVGRGNQSAGLVVKDFNHDSWLDPHLADSFCQVGGIWVNCMTERDPTEIYIANGIEQWVRSPELQEASPRSKAYHVLATHHRPSDKSYLTDVFVFNPINGALLEAILGISYIRVPKNSMTKLLLRLAGGNSPKELSPEQPKVDKFDISPSRSPSSGSSVPATVAAHKKAKPSEPSGEADIATKVKTILSDMSGLELNEIKADSQLADLGIDSLMGMELAHDLEVAFDVKFRQSDLMEVIDIPSLMSCVRKTLFSGNENLEGLSVGSESDTEESEAETSGDSTSTSTPAEVDSTEVDPTSHLTLPFRTVIQAFSETKRLTDNMIAEYNQTHYFQTVMPLQTQMCVALTLEAFDELGCGLDAFEAGQEVTRIAHRKEYSRLVDYLYRMLEKETEVVTIRGDHVKRTSKPLPLRSSKDLLNELLIRFPDQNTADNLTFYTGSRLASVLRGDTDGIQLIFGTPEGRDLVSGLYADWPLNRLLYEQMKNFITSLTSMIGRTGGMLNILEIGAGTGGTTKWLVPLLAALEVPVTYTFTDLAPSFVAAARKKFKQYSFMKFRTHNIESLPDADLIGTQHIVIASNAIHATHSLRKSAENTRRFLRPDGLLMMLEMTDTMYWVDMVFGLFEGWWFFDDGRVHAVVSELRWAEELQAAGYGHVAWTDGSRPENKLEKLIIATASGERCGPILQSVQSQSADLTARQEDVDRYVREMTHEFGTNLERSRDGDRRDFIPDGKWVVVTGGTGSLGAHLVAHLARLPDVRRVVCLNRRSKQEPRKRQEESFAKKGILMTTEDMEKLIIFETDLSEHGLGLSTEDYGKLTRYVTHIVHNAWLMNAKWPVQRFEPQFRIMRNMLELAGNASATRHHGSRVTFQFISSIATVGHWPLWARKANVPEERMLINSVLPTGYGDAKYICELMIDETLHKYPQRYRAAVVRLGQVAGSSTSGYWNSMEHFSFIVKSSQSLNAFPRFSGLLSWTPVDQVAGTLADLLLLSDDIELHPVYHVDNPIRQSWQDMAPVLADALGIPSTNVIPFKDWLERVKDSSRSAQAPERDNPAILLLDFLDDNFLRMSCGGLLLDTTNTREHSKTLRDLGPVSESLARRYVRAWKENGFLK